MLCWGPHGVLVVVRGNTVRSSLSPVDPWLIIMVVTGYDGDFAYGLDDELVCWDSKTTCPFRFYFCSGFRNLIIYSCLFMGKNTITCIDEFIRIIYCISFHFSRGQKRHTVSWNEAHQLDMSLLTPLRNPTTPAYCSTTLVLFVHVGSFQNLGLFETSWDILRDGEQVQRRDI